MRKIVFLLVLCGIITAAVGTAFAPLVTVVDKSKSHSDTSTVDLSDKDTSKPVKLLR